MRALSNGDGSGGSDCDDDDVCSNTVSHVKDLTQKDRWAPVVNSTHRSFARFGRHAFCRPHAMTRRQKSQSAQWMSPDRSVLGARGGFRWAVFLLRVGSRRVARRAQVVG